jgi:hypothetical protein
MLGATTGPDKNSLAKLAKRHKLAVESCVSNRLKNPEQDVHRITTRSWATNRRGGE